MLQTLLVLEIFTFLSRLFVYIEKRFDKKAKINLKICYGTDWTKNNFNIYCPISQVVQAIR